MMTDDIQKTAITVKPTVKWNDFKQNFKPLLLRVINDEYWLLDDEYHSAMSFGMAPAPLVDKIEKWLIKVFQDQQQDHYDKQEKWSIVKLDPEFIKEIKSELGTMIYSCCLDVHKEQGGKVVV